MGGVDVIGTMARVRPLVLRPDVLNNEFGVKVDVLIATSHRRNMSAVLAPRHHRLRTEHSQPHTRPDDQSEISMAINTATAQTEGQT